MDIEYLRPKKVSYASVQKYIKDTESLLSTIASGNYSPTLNSLSLFLWTMEQFLEAYKDDPSLILTIFNLVHKIRTRYDLIERYKGPLDELFTKVVRNKKYVVKPSTWGHTLLDLFLQDLPRSSLEKRIKEFIRNPYQFIVKE